MTRSDSVPALLDAVSRIAEDAARVAVSSCDPRDPAVLKRSRAMRAALAEVQAFRPVRAGLHPGQVADAVGDAVRRVVPVEVTR